MAEVVDFPGLVRPPRWGAMISLGPIFLSDKAQAQHHGFWGQDDLEPHERLLVWADALERFAADMRKTAEEIRP